MVSTEAQFDHWDCPIILVQAVEIQYLLLDERCENVIEIGKENRSIGIVRLANECINEVLVIDRPVKFMGNNTAEQERIGIPLSFDRSDEKKEISMVSKYTDVCFNPYGMDGTRGGGFTSGSVQYR